MRLAFSRRGLLLAIEAGKPGEEERDRRYMVAVLKPHPMDYDPDGGDYWMAYTRPSEVEAIARDPNHWGTVVVHAPNAETAKRAAIRYAKATPVPRLDPHTHAPPARGARQDGKEG